jgi:YD repeat-containing protein
VTITRTYYAGTALATEEDDGTREVVNTYNVLLELTATDWSVSASAFKSLDFTYDDAGNRDEMIDPEGAISGYSYTYKCVYDDDNRLWKVKRGGTDEAVYLYDASGHVKEVTLGNGSKTTYEYTDRYQTSKVKTATSGGTTRAEYTHTYDSRMRCTQQVRNHLGETIDYTYDAADRLTDEDSGGSSGSPPITVPARNLTWTYDDAGNRTSANDGSSTTNYTFNSESRVTAESLANGDGYAYTNDANGNRTDRDFTPNGGGSPTIQETYGYDHLNRLSSYVKAVSGSGTMANVAYAHSPMGQRLSKIDVSGNTTEWYMSDADEVVTDYTQSGSGAVTHAVSYVNAMSKVARVTASSGAKHYFVADAQLSVAHLISSTQSIANSQATDAWGNVVGSSYSLVDRYAFEQGQNDPETGLLYHIHSQYDPRLGINLQGSASPQPMSISPEPVASYVTKPLSHSSDPPCPEGKKIPVPDTTIYTIKRKRTNCDDEVTRLLRKLCRSICIGACTKGDCEVDKEEFEDPGKGEVLTAYVWGKPIPVLKCKLSGASCECKCK